MIIVDPSPDADPTRGSVCDELVESIDLAPTFVDWMGGNSASQSHRLEGRSLLPLIRGGPLPAWRDHVFSEYDYSTSQTAVRLGVKPRDARLFMVADKRWKYVHAIGFRPMLFDLESDPNELVDLGADSGHEDVRQRLAAVLAEWGLRMSQRTTLSEAEVESRRGKSQRRGILVGVWEEGELPADLWSGYYGERK